MKRLFKKKGIRSSFVDLEEKEGENHLKRHLKGSHLVSIGIGAIIGAGIFVITGQAAALYAGPAIVLSFCVAALICMLVGLCYAELAAMIPVPGSSFAYSYVALGELPAWIIGWSVIGQAIISASTVSVGWGGYFVSFLKDLGLQMPAAYAGAPIAWSSELGWHWTGTLFNLPAIGIVLFLTILISIGIRAAAHFNNVMVVIKLCTVVLFVIIGIPYIHSENWIPFVPDNTGIFGEFGVSGILRASGLVFFAYIGFDTVATLAQDSVDPQKNIPRGILGSLSICTVAYIFTALVLTGVVSYTALNVPDPMSVALQAMGPKIYWFKFIVKVAILAGLTTVVLVQILGQSRMLLALSKDGLLPKAFGKIYPKTRTPIFGTLITGLACVVVAGIFSVEILAQFVSIATLFVFGIVCLGVLVLRKLHPEVPRPFKVPFVPIVPLLGIATCFGQMCMLPLITWVQLVAWIAIGLLIYFGYGLRNSVVQNTKSRGAR